MTIKAVQYAPDYCKEAKVDAELNGYLPWRWDSSHDLSIIDVTGKRHYIGQYQSSDAAYQAGLELEKEYNQ